MGFGDCGVRDDLPNKSNRAQRSHGSQRAGPFLCLLCDSLVISVVKAAIQCLDEIAPPQTTAQQKTIGQSRKTVRWYVFSTWSDRRGLSLVSQANCFRRLTSVRIRSASRAASNGFRKVSLNTERSKPDALSSSLSRPIRTVSVNSVFLRRF